VFREEKRMTPETKAAPRPSRLAKWWQFFTLALA
jgi:hypothetical protein